MLIIVNSSGNPYYIVKFNNNNNNNNDNNNNNNNINNNNNNNNNNFISTITLTNYVKNIYYKSMFNLINIFTYILSISQIQFYFLRKSAAKCLWSTHVDVAIGVSRS